MDERITFMQDDKEKLVDEILRLRQQVETLRQELEKVKEKNFLKANPPQIFKIRSKKKSKPPGFEGTIVSIRIEPGKDVIKPREEFF